MIGKYQEISQALFLFYMICSEYNLVLCGGVPGKKLWQSKGLIVNRSDLRQKGANFFEKSPENIIFVKQRL